MSGQQSIAWARCPCSSTNTARVRALVRSVRLQLKQHKDARFAFVKGKGERTLIWQEGSIWCRARCDWIRRTGRNGRTREIWDFKTTEGSAAPQSWAGGQLFNLGGAIQAAFYCRGAMALYKRPVIFRFVVAELDPPHGVSVISLAPEAMELANFQCEMAIEAWSWCQKQNTYPGYAARTFSADPPAWLAREIEQQKLQRSMDQDSGIDPFRLSIELWRP